MPRKKLVTSNGLTAGDCVVWESFAEEKLCPEYKGATKRFPGPFIVIEAYWTPSDRFHDGVYIADITNPAVKISRQCYESNNHDPHDWTRWWCGFFRKDRFLTAAHKAQKRKRSHATLDLPIS